MNFRRFIGPGSHLFKTVCLTENAPASIRVEALAKAKVENRRIWRRRESCSRNCMQSLTEPEGIIAYTLRKLMMIEKKEPDSVTKSDLIRWAMHLMRTGDDKSAKETLNLVNDASKNQSSHHMATTTDKEGKHYHAIEIFEWMEEERKRVSLTTCELDLILRTKGYTAADAYVRKLYPNLNHVDWLVRRPVARFKAKILIGYELPEKTKGTRVVRCIGTSGYPTHFRN
ncbi:hypothetical protein ARALYDRAFT_908416 [Arabidopsis lyrata subsp. lyrata]|uniref:Uncharacterized protein n=1 Tax=Arabidopsis lyrata subsp. lyrata TaxID=81972 RepID=D7LYA8_ARALL|nr:hypothetical protein ARALYDRAFT_908416 [Arabidopsis lyrata subsp. lyrata]